MEFNNIHFIIRGHQDYPFNSFLFAANTISLYDRPLSALPLTYKNLVDEFKLNDIIEYNKDVKLSYKLKEKMMFLYTLGYICKIKINNDRFKKLEKVLPILTISTNTSIDRPLNVDSFIMLKTQ